MNTQPLHHIRVLGTAQFILNQQQSNLLKSSKGVALVSYLIVTGAPQSREGVADLLVEAKSTIHALKNLRSLLNRIRRFVPELEISRKTHTFVPTPHTEVDLYQLRIGLSANDPIEAAKAFQLYQGDLLEGFYLNDAPRFNEWLTIERERLRQQVLTVNYHLCQKLFDQQAWQAGIELATQRLKLDSLDEEAYQWLMRFLASSGQLVQAQQQYEQCRQLLWEELGVKPSATTQKIFEELNNLAPKTAIAIPPAQPLIWDGETLPQPNPLPVGSIVPYRRNHDFIGRDQMLHALGQILLQDAIQPNGAVISGLGGLGKTQLAIEFAFRFAKFFPDGIYWMSFADPEGVADEVAAIGGARGMQLYESGSRLSLADRVGRVRRAWQEPARRLLIFDNCEDPHLLADWLPVSGGCSVIITAQMGDWPRELGISHLPLAVLAREDSVALLRRLAAHVSLHDGRQIAAELGDLPLALHLAGGFLSRYSQVTAQDYLAQLRDRDLFKHPSLSGRGSMMSPTGHDLHIGRTFAINYNQLDLNNETDAMALRLLTTAACFAPGEPIPQTDLIHATLADKEDEGWLTEILGNDSLSRLVALGFIQNQENDTVVMHRLVSAFVQTQATAQYEPVFGRVAKYLAERLSATQKELVYLGDLPLAAVHVQFVVEQGLKMALVDAAHLSAWYALHRIDVGLYVGTRRFVDEAIAIVRAHGTPEPLVLAHALNVGGTLLFKQAFEAEAWPYYEESYAICRRELGDGHIRTINALQNLAILQWKSGRLEEALAIFEEALRHHEALEPPQEQLKIRVLQNTGAVLNQLGRYMDAQHHQEQVLAVRQRTLPADHPQIGETYNSLGAIAFRRGEYATAVGYFEQTVQIRLKVFGTDNIQLAIPTLNLGQASAYMGKTTAAITHLSEALRLRRLAFPEDSPLVARALALIGRVQRLAGDLPEAEAHLAQALAVFERTQPDHLNMAEAKLDLALVRLAQGQINEATTLLQQAQAIYNSVLTSDNPNMAPLLNALGELALAQGDHTAAHTYFAQVRNLLTDKVSPTHVDLVQALRHLA